MEDKKIVKKEEVKVAPKKVVTKKEEKVVLRDRKGNVIDKRKNG